MAIQDRESAGKLPFQLRFSTVFGIILIMMVLYQFSRVHYLLFHSIAEIFSITIGCAVFMISWNARKQIGNPYLVYLGIAYLFIAIIDLFHTLSFAGMNIFTDYNYYANQLWIGARYMESLSLLAFFLLVGNRRSIPFSSVFVFYLSMTVLLLASVFYWKIFPICFVEGKGLTPFKVYSEYIISLILLGALALLYRKRKFFDGHIRQFLGWALGLTILGELAFTFYISNYGFSNLVGHFLKIGSFYLVYKAIIKTGLSQPYLLLFKELKESELDLQEKIVQLKESEKQLHAEIKVRKETESQKESLITELEGALKDVNTLSGLVPICANCKSIRDDQGYWKRLEAYLESKTDLLFSHSICPKCTEELYGKSDWYQKRFKTNKS